MLLGALDPSVTLQMPSSERAPSYSSYFTMSSISHREHLGLSGLHPPVPSPDNFALRLWYSVTEQDDPGKSVACRVPRCTHQCARASCSSPGSQAFLATSDGQACPCAVRQHIVSVSHKPSGWHQVCMAAPHTESPMSDQPVGHLAD